MEPPASARTSQPARETLFLALSAIAGVLLVAVILYADRPFATESEAQATWDKLNTGGWPLWIALVVGQGALWGVILPLLVREHRTLRAATSRRDLVVTLGPLVVLSLVADVVRWFTRIDSPLPWHFAKVTVLTWLGTAVALIAVAGIVRVGRGATSLRPEAHADDGLDDYLALRSHLRAFLFSAGALIGGAVLAAGALQNAAVQYGSEHARPEGALLYGTFLSTLLAAAYAPAFFALRRAGEAVLDAIEPKPARTDAAWPLGRERRRELRAFLDLDSGVFANLRVGVAVLAPVVSGLVTVLLPQ